MLQEEAVSWRCLPFLVFLGEGEDAGGWDVVAHGGVSKAGCFGAVSVQTVVCKVSWHGA